MPISNHMDHLPPLVVLLLGLFAGAIVGGTVMWVRHCLTLRSAVDAASRRSVAISRSTLKGKLAEQMAPLLPGFPYLPADARFLGDPIDYVIFNGYTSVKDDGGDCSKLEVVILDIKQGGAKLSESQRAVAQAVEAGRVRFEVIRVGDDGNVSVQSHRPRGRGATRVGG